MEELFSEIALAARCEIHVYRDETCPLRHTGFLVVLDDEVAFTVDFDQDCAQLVTCNKLRRLQLVSEELFCETVTMWEFFRRRQVELRAKLLTAEFKDEDERVFTAILVLRTQDSAVARSILQQMFVAQPVYYLLYYKSNGNCRDHVRSHVQLMRERADISQQTVDCVDALLALTTREDNNPVTLVKGMASRVCHVM